MDTAIGGGGGGTLVPALAKEIMSIFEMAIYFLRGIICSEDLSFGHVLLWLLIGALCLVLVYAVGKLSRECCVPHHVSSPLLVCRLMSFYNDFSRSSLTTLFFSPF